jgi:uncharacterized protein (TIGR03000 family)
MTRRIFLALPALALVCVLALPETSQAQFLRGMRGAGWGGSGYGGFSNFGGSWGNGFGYNNFGYSPYGWNNWNGYNVYTPGYYGNNNWTTPGNYYARPYYDNSATGYANVIPSGNYNAFYPQGTLVQGGFVQGGQPGMTDNSRARIHVHVPANAQVFFDNSPTRQQGSEREFMTPPLEANHNYTYEVSARWTDANGKEHRENRTVRMTPGQSVNVNFMSGGTGHVDDSTQGTRTPRSPQDVEDNTTQPNRNRLDGTNPNPGTTNPNRNPTNPLPNNPPRPNTTNDTPR